MPTTTMTKFDGATASAVQALDHARRHPGLIINSYNDGQFTPQCYRLTFAVGTSLYGDADPVGLEITFRRDGSPIGMSSSGDLDLGWRGWRKTYNATEVTVELLRALARADQAESELQPQADYEDDKTSG